MPLKSIAKLFIQSQAANTLYLATSYNSDQFQQSYQKPRDNFYIRLFYDYFNANYFLGDFFSGLQILIFSYSVLFHLIQGEKLTSYLQQFILFKILLFSINNFIYILVYFRLHEIYYVSHLAQFCAFHVLSVIIYFWQQNKSQKH